MNYIIVIEVRSGGTIGAYAITWSRPNQMNSRE